MHRRTRVNLVLVAILSAVALVLHFTRPEPPAAGDTLPAMDARTVREIGIQRPGKPPIRFRSDGSTWHMVEPARAPAHFSRIAAMLTLPGAPSAVRFPAGDVDLARFGLDAPEVTLVIDGRAFAFGDPGPLDDARYVLADGSVYLVADSLFLQLVQDAPFFLDSRLLAGPGAPERIVYPDFEIARAGETWERRPAGGVAKERIESAARAWQAARAFTMRIGSAEGAPLTVYREGGAVDEFRIVSTEPAVVLARPDFNVTYHLDAATAESLLLVPPAPAHAEADAGR